MTNALQFGMVQRAANGQFVCGDAYAILDTASGSTIIALADGLGHGPSAADASRAFITFVEDHLSESLEQILRGASESLSHTRGNAAALVRIHERNTRLSFAGVGNIELQAVSQEPIRPISSPGIVGRRIHQVLQFDYGLSAGDFLAMYTDGISSRMELSNYRNMTPQTAADSILAEHGKSYDDATCIVLRC